MAINDTEQEATPNDEMTVYHDERPRVVAEQLQQRHMVHAGGVHLLLFVHEVEDYCFGVRFGVDDARCLDDFVRVAVLVLDVGFFPVLHGKLSL